MADESKAGELLYFNGLDVTTGAYDVEPMSSETLWRKLKGEDERKSMQEEQDDLDELKGKRDRLHHGFDAALEEDGDPMSLASAGWGVIFASDADPAVKESLSPLLAWRKKQAGDDLFRVFEGPDGYGPGESKNSFLKRFGAGPGPVKPDKVPYYLLIVGSPDKIPYRFQTQLDVQYAVGRIHFDTLEEYANYAQSVVTAESGEVKLARKGAFFGVANEDDKATQMSARHLVAPLFQKFSNDEKFKSWELKAYMKEQATRSQLEALLGGEETPSFLFTASHGASFPMGDKGDKRQWEMQRLNNGALICQDWPGPREWRKPLPEEFYLAGDHLASDSNLLGLIAFFFACYGGGTPKMDEFTEQAFRESPRQIAPNNFLAHLPNKMLSQPKGGALAVVGHVERAWGYSFVWPQAGEQTGVFEDTLKRLLRGYPVGYAFERFNERYAEMATMLSDQLEHIKRGGKEKPFEMVELWTANNDARGYAIIGDPAVRLPLADEGAAGGERPVIEVTHRPPADEPESKGDGAVAEAESEGESAAASEADERSAAGDEAATDFAIQPSLGEFGEKYPELEKEMLEDWVKQLNRGYKNQEQVFQRILNTFLRDHRTTVIMYWILFVVGLGLFIAGAVLTVALDDYIPAAIFGGLGVVSFLSFFVGRSLQSVEENLEYITWLGMIYNTYWTQQAWTQNPDGAHEILKDATNEALAQLEHMVDKHANARRLRPKLGDEE